MRKHLITAYMISLALIVLTGLFMGLLNPAFATENTTSSQEATTEAETTPDAATTTEEPTTTPAPTTTTEEPTTTEIPKHHIYFIETGATGSGKLLKSSDYLMVTEKNSGTPVWEMGGIVEEGSMLHFEKMDPDEGIYTLSYVVIWKKDKEGSGDSGKSDGTTQDAIPFDFVVDDYPIIIEVRTIIDARKESMSIAESESISESESIAESESISRSEEEESESISRSEQEEKDKLNLEYGGYTILNDLSGVQVPYDTFFSARDTTTFRKSINAFYSSTYRVFVYYAEKTGFHETASYFVDNPMTASLIPFKVIKDQNGKKYVVTAAKGVSLIPGNYQRDILVDMSDESVIYRANGYVVTDPSGDQLILLALANEQGEQGFYVYEGSSRDYKLTPYDEYEARKGTPEPTTSTVPETTPAPERNPIEDNLAIWLMILGGVVLVILTALIIVFFMSRRQQQEEDELDLQGEEEDGEDDEDFDDFGAYQENEDPEEVLFDISSYRNPATQEGSQEEASFEMNFEDAFPDEVRTAVNSATGASEEVTQAFDFTFDFGKAESPEEVKTKTEEVTYVDLQKEETPKPPKNELNGEEFEEIHYGPKEPESESAEGR